MRSAGSILLLTILVPVTLVVFVVLSVQANIATAQFIKHELASRHAYAIAEDQLASQIANLRLDNLPVNTADLQALVRRVLPAAWLRQNIENLLDRTFAWFKGPADLALTLPVDLRGPKAELIPGIESLIESAIPRLAVCTRQTPPGELCRTANMTVAQVKDMLKQGGIDLDTVTTQLPDTFDLANPVLPDIRLGQDSDSSAQNQVKVKGVSTVSKDQQNIDEQKKKDQQLLDEQNKQNPEPPKSFQDQVKEAVQKLTDVKDKYHQGLKWWTEALGGYLLLILMYLAVNIKGWRRFMRWFGILLLSIGILPLAVSIASKIVLKQYLLPLIHFNGTLSAEAQTAVPAAILDVQHALFFPILLVSAIMVGLGLAGIIGASFIPKIKKPE